MNSQIKRENFAALADYLDYLQTHPRLSNLFLEVTDRCNLCCTHCGSGCSNGNRMYLNKKKISEVLTDIARNYNPNFIRICITGGEPLMHPDIIEIISTAHQLGFLTGVTTNGTLIDDKMARNLISAGLNTVAISIDGFPEKHDRFRNSPGAFDKAVSGIMNLRKYGLETQVTTVVYKDNLCDLEDIYLMLKDMGITSWALVNMDPIGRAKKHNDMLLDGKELMQLYRFIREKRFDPDNDMEVTTACSHFQGMDFEHETRDWYFQCQAGTRTASIAANGDIIACLDIERRPEHVQGNIYKDSFLDIWDNRFEIFRKNRALESRMCSECEYKKECRGDSAHTWDYEKSEPNYCIKKLAGGEG